MHLLFTCLALLGLTLAGSISERQTTCYSGVYIIDAPPRGQNVPGIQSTLIQKIQAGIPNSYANVLQYDSGNPNNSLAIASGVAMMRAAVINYAAACPGAPMVLMGWSQGGIVVMNTLCGNVNTGRDRLGQKYNKSIIASIPYGQETFVPGMKYDKGTCVSPGFSLRPRVHPHACRRFAKNILDYCDSGDGPCCNGTDPNAHFAYQHYDTPASQFVINAYYARQQQ